MDNALRIPDIEIIVGASGDDIAVFAFYRREDIHQGYEVVSIVSGKSALSVVRAVLQDALTSCNSTDWFHVAQLDEGQDTKLDSPPF